VLSLPYLDLFVSSIYSSQAFLTVLSQLKKCDLFAREHTVSEKNSAFALLFAFGTPGMATKSGPHLESSPKNDRSEFRQSPASISLLVHAGHAWWNTEVHSPKLARSPESPNCHVRLLL
jgi:hypothetical protein